MLKSGPSVRHLLAAAVITTAAITPARAQDAAPAAQGGPVLGWRHQFNGMLNLSQVYFDNWAKGGTDALAWDINLAGGLALERDKFLWENTAKVIYGQTKLADLDSRKSSDEWKLETIYTYKLGTLVNPFAAAAGWSQFTAGYQHDDKAGTKTLTTEFFDPAYFTQTLGVGITPIPDFKERLGFTIKETYSAERGFANDVETLGEVEESRIEYGLSSVTEYQKALMENILASTKLDVFMNFKGMDEIDGRWENKVTAKVNKIISVNFELELLYDKDLSEDTQTRQGLTVGIAFLSL